MLLAFSFYPMAFSCGRDPSRPNKLGRGTPQPEMARLTLARKIAAIVLKIWKKGEAFNADHLNLQAA